VLHTTFYLRKRTGLVAGLVGGAAIVNLATNALLVPAHGGLGAAWATLVSFAALAVATWILAERVWTVGFELRRIAAPILVAGGLAFGASRLCAHGGPWDGGGVATAAAKIAVLLALPLILVLGGYLDPAEKAKIRSVLAGLRRPRSGVR
jgi:O-antigen/teichoic acid export membrane protein